MLGEYEPAFKQIDENDYRKYLSGLKMTLPREALNIIRYCAYNDRHGLDSYITSLSSGR